MLRISFLAVNIWEVVVVAVTDEPLSLMERTGVERWIVPGLRREARPSERDCVPMRCWFTQLRIYWRVYLF
jgi:hypothetical protein